LYTFIFRDPSTENDLSGKKIKMLLRGTVSFAIMNKIAVNMALLYIGKEAI